MVQLIYLVLPSSQFMAWQLSRKWRFTMQGKNRAKCNHTQSSLCIHHSPQKIRSSYWQRKKRHTITMRTVETWATKHKAIPMPVHHELTHLQWLTQAWSHQSAPLGIRIGCPSTHISTCRYVTANTPQITSKLLTTKALLPHSLSPVYFWQFPAFSEQRLKFPIYW